MNKDSKLIGEAYAKVLEQQAPLPGGLSNAKELLDKVVQQFVAIKDDNILRQKIAEFVRSTPAGKNGNMSEALAKTMFDMVKAAQTGKPYQNLGRAVPMPGYNLQKQNTTIPMPFKSSRNFAVPMPGMRDR